MYFCKLFPLMFCTCLMMNNLCEEQLNVPKASYNFTWNKLVGVVHVNARDALCVKEIKAGERT